MLLIREPAAYGTPPRNMRDAVLLPFREIVNT